MGDGPGAHDDLTRDDPGEQIGLQLMGTFRVRPADRAPLVLPRGAARVLAYLGVYGPTARQDLAGALWLDSAQRRASADLRTALWRLQKTSNSLIQVTRSVLALRDTVTVDLPTVERWALEAITAAPSACAPAGRPPPDAVRTLLAGWDEEWLDQPRERLRLLQIQANESIGYRLLTSGHPAEALP